MTTAFALGTIRSTTISPTFDSIISNSIQSPPLMMTKLQMSNTQQTNDNEHGNEHDDNQAGQQHQNRQQNEQVDNDRSTCSSSLSRRSILLQSAAMMTLPITMTRGNMIANAAPDISSTTTKSSSSSPLLIVKDPPSIDTRITDDVMNNNPLKCLLDLPPPSSDDVVRLYLCRHGQTENNRLGLMQGARVDSNLNDTGRKMAIRVGKAFSYLDYDGSNRRTSSSSSSSSNIPRVGAHSSLTRTRETLSIASTTISENNTKEIMMNKLLALNNEEEDNFILQKWLMVNNNDDISTTRTSGQNQLASSLLKVQKLPSLNEVDFGPLSDNKPVEQARIDTYRTYGLWTTGMIDTRLGGGNANTDSQEEEEVGESGREVLIRARDALCQLRDLAISSSSSSSSSNNNSGLIIPPSAVAVSHSTYLRMMLALTMSDTTSLLDAVTNIKQNNCCINVLDVSLTKTRTIGHKSQLFGGKLSLAPKDFELVVPEVNVVRINEVRHLT